MTSDLVRGPCSSLTSLNHRSRAMMLLAVALGTLLASVVLAPEPGFGEYRAVQESLSRVHPDMQAMAV